MNKWNLFGICVLPLLLCSCDYLMPVKQPSLPLDFSIRGTLPEFFDDGDFIRTLSLPDTNDFLLRIRSADGAGIYDGKYGNRPSEIIVLPGAYDISLSSHRFHPPGFEGPLWGDSKTAMIPSGGQASVLFTVRQLNAGARFTFTSRFRNRFPGAGVYLAQQGDTLLYGYDEERFVYFQEGEFSLLAKKEGKDTVLMTRKVLPAQMLRFRLDHAPASTTASAFRIVADTARSWMDIGFNTGLQLPLSAMSIAEASVHAGEKNVMVYGYIFGGDPSTSTVRVRPPFSSRSSLVIAMGMKEGDRRRCMAVELPSGKIRDALNLVVHPDLLGRRIVFTGNLVDSYFGYPGLKGVKSFALLE